MKLINNITKHVFVMLIVLANNHQLMAMNNESAEFSVNEKTIKQSWNFVAYLDDEEIGYHNFEVVQNNGELVVKTQAKFDVSFMFIPLYSYEHKNTEIWRNNCLISLDSSTLDDGEKLFVNLSNKNGNTRIITPDNSEASYANALEKLGALGVYNNLATKDLINKHPDNPLR